MLKQPIQNKDLMNTSNAPGSVINIDGNTYDLAQLSEFRQKLLEEINGTKDPEVIGRASAELGQLNSAIEALEQKNVQDSMSSHYDRNTGLLVLHRRRRLSSGNGLSDINPRRLVRPKP